MLRTSPGRFTPRGLSLRAKSFLFVGIVALVVTAALLALVGTVFMESMNRMQSELTKELIESVVGRLNQAARLQRSKVTDGAIRDETFAYLKGDKKGYFERAKDSKTNLAGQHYLVLFDRQKNPFAWMFSPGAAGEVRDLPGHFQADEARHTGLLLEGKSSSVILPAPGGILLLSAHPVTRGDGSGPSPGWLVYGLNIGKTWFDEMKGLTGVTIVPVTMGREAGAGRREGKSLYADALGTCRVFLSGRDADRDAPAGFSAEIEFENAAGISPAGLRLTFPSVLYSGAVELRNKLIWSSILGAVVLSSFCCLAIEHLFIRKIRRMDREFQMLVGSKDSSARLMESRNDEFGRLAGSANRLLDSLRRQRLESENQKTLFLSVLDSASEGIMAYRSLRNEKGAISDFIMVLANKSAEVMMNRNSKDMLGKCLLGLFPGNLSEGLFERYVRVVETRTGEQFEAFHPHDEIRSWFHISAEPWADGFVVTFEEIGQRKRVEQELKASIEELERFNRAMIGRENRVLEMKSEVNLLRSRMGLPPGYKIDSLNDET